MESIAALFREYSFRPRKSQGQNFLTDPKALDQIDQAIQCPPGDVLLEVGGGYGVLTERLIRKERPLVVVEPDHKLFAMLEGKFAKTPGLALVKADILKLDLSTYAPPPPAPSTGAGQAAGKITIAGNIPYYLTTPLITRLLTQYPALFRRIYLMVQKEVADRLAAKPGTKAYGALTVCGQYYSHVRKLVDVPARCFKPKPKVDSAFIELELKERFPLEGESEKKFFQMVRAIFQSRRKILSNSLKSLGKPAGHAEAVLGKLGIDPQIRGERLGLEELVRLSQALEQPF